MHINIVKGIEAALQRHHKQHNTTQQNKQQKQENCSISMRAIRKNRKCLATKIKRKRKTLTYSDINIMSPMLIIMFDTLTAPLQHCYEVQHKITGKIFSYHKDHGNCTV
jgi:hypothetical protein